MEIDDRRAMAALLTTARDILRAQVQPQLGADVERDAMMIADAMALVARALAEPGTTWPPQRGSDMSASGSGGPDDIDALRARVRARLAVTSPTYLEQIKDAPP